MRSPRGVHAGGIDLDADGRLVTLPAMDEAERDRLRAAYEAGRSEVMGEREWTALDRLPDAQAPGLILTAWNPFSRALPAAVNTARDQVLRSELAALRLAPLRARGHDVARTWVEDGWLIPHERERSLRLLRRYEQAAGYIVSPAGRGLIWHDGVEEAL